MKMKKIIFLDIDGPIISGNLFNLSYDCQINRTFMNTMALAYIRQLLMLSKAKLVINSSHNSHIVNGRTIKDDLIKWGINSEYFHENWKTTYPENMISLEAHNSPALMEDDYFINPRTRGVLDWLKKYGEDTHWIAFDDENFIDSPSMIHVSYDEGITKKDFNKACEIFQLENPTLLMPF